MDIRTLESVKEVVNVIAEALNIVIDEEKHIEEMAKEWSERDVN